MVARYLGKISYDDGLREQAASLDVLSKAESRALILGLEHTPVVTLGVRGNVEDDLATTPEQLRVKGFELRETARGGQATLHAPGQLVIYPCLNLKAFGLGARAFVELVQSSTEKWLLQKGVSATASSHEPGLFVDGAKIAAFGFKISRGFTSHGLAINVRNELSDFDLIRTCGVSKQRVARLQDFGVTETLEMLFLSWVQIFRANLDANRAQT